MKSKLLKKIFVTLMVFTVFMSNIPMGGIDFLVNKFNERKIVDSMWLAQNDRNVVDSLFVNKAEAAVISQYTGGLLVYADTVNVGTPKYKVFDDTTGFGAEQSASSVGAAAINWIRVAASPTADEWIIATRDASNVIKAQVCTGVDGGVSCGAATTVTATAGTHGFRNFDIAYEMISGHALLVYGNATVDMLRKIEWTGSWVNDAVIALGATAGAVEWVELTSRAASNQIGIAYSDTADDVAAFRWDGTTAANPSAVITATGSATDVRKFDVAFEGLSGDMLVMAQVAAAGTWAGGQLVGTTWTIGTQTLVDGIGAYIDIADGDPSTNDLAIVSSFTNAYEGAEWSGTGIVDAAVAVDATTGTWAANYHWATAAFVSATYTGVNVFEDTTGTDDISWTTMDSAGAYTLRADNLRTRGVSRHLKLYDYPNANKVLLLTEDANSDLWADTWAGAAVTSTAWTNLTSAAALTTNLSIATKDVSDFAFRLAPSPTTTLSTGSDPGNSTIAPGGGITSVDGFTLTTNVGTNAITGIVVNLSTNSGVGTLTITNGTDTVLGSIGGGTGSGIVTGSNSISITSTNAVTTGTAFVIKVTPLSHAAMPAPNGAFYSITAVATDWTGSNTKAGQASDTSSTVTIDNLSPTSATVPLASTAGDTKVTLNWTTTSGETTDAVVLRWTGVSAGAEVPVEGSSYTAGNTIVGVATATVACAFTGQTTATALVKINGTGGSAGCTTTALTNGQAYSYKVFSKDSNGNYDTGTLINGSPLTPVVTTTLTTGTDPGDTTIAPGGAITAVDGFSLTTGSGTNAITAIVVNLSSNSGVGTLTITNAADTVLGSTGGGTGSGIVTGSNTISITSTNAVTTGTAFKIKVTPLSHTAMSAPPGGTYSITTVATDWTGSGTKAGQAFDTSSTVIIDNTSPAGVTASTATAGNALVNLAWSNPTDTDFTTGGTVVVLRHATTVVSTVPVEGVTYTVGNVISGTDTVACVVTGSPPATTCQDSGLTNGTAYHYKIFTQDSRGNYDAGTVPTGSPATPVVPNLPPTIALNSPADASSDTNVTPTLNFTGTDVNSDNIEYNVQVDPVNTFNSGSVFNSLNATGATKNWSGVSVNPSNGDVYAVVGSGDIYKQTAGTGTWNALNATGAVKSWTGISVNSSNGDVYAVVSGGDIYKQTAGTGTWNALNATGATKLWTGVSVNSSNGDVYASVNSGDIYKQTAGTGTWNALNATGATKAWYGVSVNPSNGDVYAVVYIGDIYKQTAGTGTWNALNATGATKSWHGVSVNSSNGDVYAVVSGGDIYKQTAGTGTWNALNATGAIKSWYGVSVNSTNGYVYAVVWGGDIYKQTVSFLDKFSTVDAGFTAGHPFASGVAKDFTVQTGDKLAPSTYYWRVRGKDPTGSNTYGAWSSTWFTVIGTTTLGNGTDGASSTIGPGGSATEIDRFSLVTASGTDTVTGMTVTLAGDVNAYTNIATVDVVSTYFEFLNATGATKSWHGVSVNSTNGDVYAVVDGGDIYKQTAGTGTWNALNATGATKLWYGVSVNSTNGDVYAAVYGGDIYKQTAGTGTWNALNATGAVKNWWGVSVNSTNGDVYATVYGGDIYKQTAGTGTWNALNATGAVKNWRGISVNSTNGDVYAAVYSGDIYKSGVSKCSLTPTSNTVLLTNCAIAVTTIPTEYKILITPKTHANMPAVPGASYVTTATVTAWTGTNTNKVGADTGSATITVDNLSPTSATVPLASTAGDASVTLKWTTTNGETTDAVVLRWVGASPGAQVPAEGTTYATGDTSTQHAELGTATVACLFTGQTTATALVKINGTGGDAGCDTTALTNSQAYSYKVFSKDSNGNYDAGTLINGSPLTPVSNLPPTVSLNTPTDASSDSDTTPNLNFTGTDVNSDNIEYNVQVDTANTFNSANNLLDSYSEVNQDNSNNLYSGFNTAQGQTFTAVAGTLTLAKFYIKNAGASSGNMMYAKLYAITGTYGNDAVPTGSVLATSDAVDVSVLSSSYQLIDFPFSNVNQISLVNGTQYAIFVEYMGPDGIQVGMDGSGSSHSGNMIVENAGWWGYSGYDSVFYVYITSGDPLLSKFSNIPDAGFTAGHPFASGVATDYTIQAGETLADGTYYWRVAGIDPGGSNAYGAWSPTRSFTISSAHTTTIGTTGTQTASVSIPTANQFVGGAFTLTRDSGSANVTGMTVTVNNATGLSNMKLYTDTVASCTTANPVANATLFGTTATVGTTTTITGSAAVTSTPRCMYVVVNVGSGAADAQTLDVSIASIANVTVSTDTISGTPAIAGTTTLNLPGVVVSGTIYANEVPTAYNCSTGNVTVRVAKNGVLSQSVVCSAAGGTYTLPKVTGAVSGDVLTVFIDNATTSKQGVIVTKANDGTSPLTLNLYQQRVIVRNENAVATTNANMSQYCGSGCTGNNANIPFTYSAGNITISALNKLIVWTGKTFTPGGTVTTTASATTANPDGDITIQSGATLSMGTNAFSIGGDFLNQGTFSYGAGQITTFTATGTGFTIEDGTNNFDTLVFNGAGGGWTFGSTVTTVGNLTITAGNLTMPAFAYTIGGATSITGTLTISSSTGAKAFTGNVTVNAGGTWNNSGNAAIGLSGNLTNNQNFTAGSGVYTMSGAGKTITGIISIPSLTINGTTQNNGTLTVATALAGTSTLTNGATGILNIGQATVPLSGGTLIAFASGNIINYTAAAPNCKVATYDILNFTGSGVVTCAVVNINQNLGLSGTVSLTTTSDIDIGSLLTVGTGTTLTTGAFILSAVDVVVNGTGTLNNNGTFTTYSLTGTGTFVNGAAGIFNISFGSAPSITTLTATASGNIVNYTAAAPNCKVVAYHHLNFTGSGAVTCAVTTIGGNLGMSGTTTWSTTSSINTTGTFTNNSSGAITNNNTFTATAGLAGIGSFINAAAGTLNIGFASAPAITTLTATASGNIVNYTAAAPNCKVVSYHHLNFTGSGAVTCAVTTVAGNLGLSTSGSMAWTTSSILSIAGNLTVGNGVTLTQGAFPLTVTGNTTLGGGTSGAFTGSGSSLTLYGNLTLAVGSTWTKGAGTVIFMKNGAQVITDNTASKQDLGSIAIIANGGTSISLATNAKLSLLNVGPSTTFDISNKTLTLTGSGTPLVNVGTFTTTGSTVEYSSVSSPSIANITYNNLLISGTISAVSASATVGGLMTISGTFSPNAGTMTLNGGLTNNGTMTASGTNTFVFATSTTAAIAGTASATQFQNFSVSGIGGAKTLTFKHQTTNAPIFTFNGTVTLTGASTQLITINSDDGTNQWLAHFGIAGSPSYVLVSNSGCDAGTADMTIDANSTLVINNGSCWKIPVSITTLGNGTDGASSTIGPGATATEVDRFSLVMSSGTDTVSGMTVTLAPAGAFNNIATVDVQTTGSVSKCSLTPTSNTVLLTSCAIAVNTTPTEYKVLITPKTHAAMPAVPGASYATTATVTSITAGNSTTGEDSNFNALNATGAPQGWMGVSVNSSNGDVYATTNGASGDIYKQTAGTGSFVALNATGAPKSWVGISVNSSNGDVYAAVSGGDIYKQTAGTGNFDVLNATGSPKVWRPVFVDSSNGDVYIAVNGGDIYKQTAGTGAFNALNATGATKFWRGISVNSSGDVYAAVLSGDIYKQTAGTGVFNALNATEATKAWQSVSVNKSNGDVYAAVNNGDIYKQTAGTGAFNALNVTGATKSWQGVSVNFFNGDVYAVVGSGGDIYKQTPTITVDNLSPGGITLGFGSAGNTVINLTWLNPSDADFITGGSVVVLRHSGSAVTTTPVEGATYVAGNVIASTDTVVCAIASNSASGKNCQDSGLTNGTDYYYKIFTKDIRGNYNAGNAIVQNPVRPVNFGGGGGGGVSGGGNAVGGGGQSIVVTSPDGGSGGGGGVLPQAFIGANGTTLVGYDSGWTLLSGNFGINNNAINSNTAATDTMAVWNSGSFNNNQYTEMILAALSSGNYIGVAVRAQSGAQSGYGAYSDSNTNTKIIKWTAGTPTDLYTGAAFSPGDIIRLEIYGTTLTLKKNGTTITTTSDATYASGKPGIVGKGNSATSSGDNFYAGSLASQGGGGGGGDAP